ncbi:HAD-IIIC family phosphatase [Serratia sp. CY85251]|uniref:HAD-IIIC family phosphatase n=1 Tax=Serratia sp. CY85251 TaxID=3383696 RepID=UPI003FA0732F
MEFESVNGEVTKEERLISYLKESRKEIKVENIKERLPKILLQFQTAESLSKAGYLLRTIPEKIGCDSLFKGKVKVSIISNFVCDEIVNFMRVFFMAENIFPEIFCAGYNQYITNLIDTNSTLYNEPADITLCLLDEHVFFDKLSSIWSTKDLVDAIDNEFANLRDIFNNFLGRNKGLFVFNTLFLSKESYDTVIDYRSKVLLSSRINKLNYQLQELFSSKENVAILDTNLYLQDRGTGLKDDGLSYYAKMHFSNELLMALGRECFLLSKSIKSLTKKCLVLDCDNTLWGGVIGDDGLTGIELSGTPSGDMYAHFQSVIKILSKQGVILAVNSKNSKENTDQVFSAHPNCILKETDFSWQCVNWEPKYKNILEISRQLNISTNHIVFLDDSDFECSMVKKMLPEVTVVKLSEILEERNHQLLSPGFFNTLFLTQEDLARGQNYYSELERRKEKEKFSDISTYLATLDIKVTMRFADNFMLPRITQMTQRTNQFNLTTKRLSNDQIKLLSMKRNNLIIAAEVEDKFGSSGVVGCLFVDIDDVGVHIRNFILSCRVFSRGIETAMLISLENLAIKRGWRAIYGYFALSEKNKIFQDFYKQHNFKPFHKKSPGIDIYKLDVSKTEHSIPPVSWITIDDQLF